MADLTLNVPKGEVFGFLGPNGAGKSTAVKMLLGLVRPDGGEARVLGTGPGVPATLARIGFLPEHFRFHEWLTAQEFLDVHGRLYGMSKEARRRRIPKRSNSWGYPSILTGNFRASRRECSSVSGWRRRYSTSLSL